MEACSPETTALGPAAIGGIDHTPTRPTRKQIITCALDNRGVLSRLKAELRANVFLAVDEQDRRQKSDTGAARERCAAHGGAQRSPGLPPTLPGPRAPRWRPAGIAARSNSIKRDTLSGTRDGEQRAKARDS